MNKTKSYRKLSRIMATFLLFTIGFVYCSGFTAFAAVDLDITTVPPPDSVTNNERFSVDFEIVTKSTNGYVELQVNISYDADMLNLAAPVNKDGYRVTGSNGQLTLTYYDPTGTNTPTPIGNHAVVTVDFIVQENAADGITKISASVDHAYNSSGKNITWTPIYDKEVEIVRINQSDSASSEVSSEEAVSSEFVVGNGNAGVVTRTSSAAGNGGKIAAVLIGAIVIFAAGIVVGYIICMKKYEKLGNPHDGYGEYYEDDYVGDSEIGPSGGENYSDSLYSDDNDDGFYRKAENEYEAPDEDDYFSSAPTDTGGNYLDTFGAPPIGSRTVEPVEFSSMINSPDVPNDNDDDYPILFMTRDGRNSSSRRSAQPKPTFDEEVDSLFGKYSDNVDRNVDDGYGRSFSTSTRRRDTRSERSGRKR